MSQILYQARPSIWRMHPFGSLVAIALIGFGGYISLTGQLPYRAELDQLVPFMSPYSNWTGYALVVIGLFNLLGWWFASLVDKLEIHSREVVWNHGLLSKSYTEINMASIRTVRVNQSLFQRIVGAGDLTIFTSGDVPELSVKGLPRPNEIRDLIKAQSASDEA
jgi:uncharacterized membrane protein YdbT with pleckstrin-like domain